jgi:hypothetical protein
MATKHILWCKKAYIRGRGRKRILKRVHIIHEYRFYRGDRGPSRRSHGPLPACVYVHTWNTLGISLGKAAVFTTSVFTTSVFTTTVFVYAHTWNTLGISLGKVVMSVCDVLKSWCESVMSFGLSLHAQASTLLLVSLLLVSLLLVSLLLVSLFTCAS